MMRRRDFLRATLVTAGSVVVPTACSDDGDPIGICDVHEDDRFFPQSVASGDPRHDSVVLWTRLVDRKQPQSDLTLALVVALDEEFTQLVVLNPSSDNVASVGSGSTQLRVTARAEFDHCVKIKVNGLSPGTTYYYRFYYMTGDGCVSSRVGRTRTAPALDADVPVRFAFVSGQDYVGRYYNAYVALAKEELDFVVHLGGYIYETTGNPSLQAAPGQRSISFSDVDGAIAFQPAEGAAYHAAKSLSNYRELYKTYRSDRALQRVHELFPMIAVWGDHEFSDDCHGATAAYLDGREPETDEDRRKAANQAWFEYMPAEYPNDPKGDEFRYDSAVEYPDDITIYRDFSFGKHVHLVMTDLRSYRADHLIPEDAFPGKVVVQEEQIVDSLTSLLPYTSRYILDINEDNWVMTYKRALDEAAVLFGFDPSLGFAQGEPRPVSAKVVDEIVAKLNEHKAEQGEEPIPPIPPSELAFMQSGFAYADLGKTDYYSAFGSRYFVIKDAFDPYSTLTAKAEVMGEAQRAWFQKTMEDSKSTWKVWGNEYRLSQLTVAHTTEPAEPDQESLTRHFYLNCDGWDGFREERNELIEMLAGVEGNVVSITGDLGAFLAGTPAVEGATSTAKIVEFGGSAISSATYRSVLTKQLASHPTLKDVLKAEAEDIDGSMKTANPHLAFSNSTSNGFCIVEANADEFVVSMHMIPEDALAAPLYEEAQAAALDEQITITRYKTVAAESELYWDDKGTWKQWIPATAS
ncbi:alkaline phosphatase D family protein [Sorangium atrum]|uniref:Alkaline phosphatase D family protein n=1 Tax=Sorangium atrum TaxID=2995308 RepID=A0ABT5BV65_9BACT|nr:alkaline phosphatase D family protein [Sorangium aterium]MDC0678050.1 alkaline phosphatase D family protein [Sorangium aterium]